VLKRLLLVRPDLRNHSVFENVPHGSVAVGAAGNRAIARHFEGQVSVCMHGVPKIADGRAVMQQLRKRAPKAS
jgi:hypothetical protein